MKFCRYCGVQVPEEATVCPNCGKDLESAGEINEGLQFPQTFDNVAKRARSRRFKIIAFSAIAVAIIATCVVYIVFNEGKCHERGCNLDAMPEHKYCIIHGCIEESCTNRSLADSMYCSTHKAINDMNTSYVAESDLKFTDVELYTNSISTVAEGVITNNSSEVVKFVKVKGSFKDRYGTVVDTDWTYAVGSEGLAPGESSKWKMFVSRDYSIDSVSISILDFDY